MLRNQNGLRSSQPAFVSQIIYPVKDLLSIKTHAYLVGWNLENFRCCIACGIEVPQGKFDDLIEILEKCSEEFRTIFVSCSKNGTAVPMILGEWLPNLSSDYSPDASRRMGGIWITLTTNPANQSSIKFHSLYSLGMSYNTSCYLFQYDTINTDRLNCLQVEEQIGKLNGIETESVSSIIPKSELDLIVAQINCAYDLKKAIHAHLNPLLGSEDKSKYLAMDYVPSTVGILIAFVFSLGSSMLMGPTWLWHATLYKFNKFLKQKLVMFSLGSFLANWLGLRGNGSLESGLQDGESSGSGGDKKNTSKSNESGTSGTAGIEGISLCDISLTAVYFSERITTFEACLRKCAVFPSAWSQPARLKQSLWLSVLSFVTMTWLDTLIGCIVGYYIYSNASFLVAWMEQTCYSAQQSFIIDTLEWFNHSPYGIKLNPVITAKVGTALRKLVNTYHTVLSDTKMMHYPVCKLVGCVGVLGFSAQLVVVVDVFRVITLHIAAIHRALSFLHQLQIQLLYSLYLLFWGRKKNILRQRVDTCEYDKHQQLFGIVFFAIAIFCFPSFAAYYYLFAFAQLGVVMVQYVLWSTMIGIKEFPLYALHLFVWRPKLMTKGVQFSLIDTSSASAVTVLDSYRTKTATHFQRLSESSIDTVTSGQFSPSNGRLSGSECNTSPKKPLSSSSSSKNAKLKGILKTDRSFAGEDGERRRSSHNKMAMFDREQLGEGLNEDENGSNAEGSTTGGGKSHQVHFRMEDKDGSDPPEKKMMSAEDHSTESDTSVHGTSSSSGGLSILEPSLVREVLDEVDLQRESSDTSSSGIVLGSSRGGSVNSLSFQRGGGGLPELSLPFRSELPAAFNFAAKSAPAAPTNQHSRHIISKVDNFGNTVYMSLVPRRWNLFDVFAGYSLYLRYIVSEKGFAVRVLRGIFLGRPALDIQLIHATASLAYKKALKEQRDISNVFKRSAMLPLRSSRRSVRSPAINSAASGASSSGDEYLGAYDCFNKSGVRSTMKNRKSGGGRSSSGTPSSEDLAENLTNPLDYTNVYDLPHDGFPMKVSFWDTIRLAQSTIDEMDANEEESGGAVAAGAAATGGDSGRVANKRVNARQLNLSKLLLYLVLITATINLILTVCGGCLFLGSLLPLAWQMRLVTVYDSAGSWGFSSSESGVVPLRNSSTPLLLNNQTVSVLDPIGSSNSGTADRPKATTISPVDARSSKLLSHP